MDRVDADLSAEEQSYVRHYLGYADALIRSAEGNAPSQAADAGPKEKAEESAEEPEPAAGLVSEGTPAAQADSLVRRAA